jgi:two-component sensor histidine kinase
LREWHVERDVLLREIRRRVERSLQVLSSLLYLHASRSCDPRVRREFLRCRERVAALAAVQDLPYSAGNVRHIDLGPYLERLTGPLVAASRVAGDRVRIETDLAHVQVSIDAAAEIGLIVNELVANALEHGFPRDRRGLVRVTLRSLGDEGLSLVVEDDGIGLPEGQSEGPGLGLTLVEMLACQIGASLRRSGSPGTRFDLDVPRAATAADGEPASRRAGTSSDTSAAS